ncbi:glycosyltransferase [Mobilicoccus pelagius]|nr:glycosyltransferase [Mobilicoccus pelagius]
MLALAHACRARGETVRVVALREYGDLVAGSGAEHIPVEADVADALWHPDPWVRRVLLAQPGLMYAQMTARLRRAAPLVVDALDRASRPGDTVVAGLATAGIATALHDRRAVLALFAPVLPSREPSATVMTPGLRGWPTTFTSTWGWMLSTEMSGRAGRLVRARSEGVASAERTHGGVSTTATERWSPRAATGSTATDTSARAAGARGLRLVSAPGARSLRAVTTRGYAAVAGWGHALLGVPGAAVVAGRLPILLAADPALVPPAPDRPVGVRQTGFWTLPSDDVPAPRGGGAAAAAPGRPGGSRVHEGGPATTARLEEFLAAGPPPVYVGFGSCPAADPAADQRMFVAAARRAGVRVVLQPPPGAAPEAGDDVLVLGEYPHERLLPRMAAVVHHGGAGTTAAAVRAGVPSAVVPHLGDQGYWGRRIADLGAGLRPVPRARLTTERLARLLAEVTGPDAPAMRRAAQDLAARLRTDGAERAADLLLGDPSNVRCSEP